MTRLPGGPPERLARAGVTEREAEVLSAVAERLHNREIADRLYILIQAELYYQVMTATLGGDVDVLERIGTALADPTRRRILTMLLVGPAYPAELARVLGVSRAKASNHLACLRGCGLVTATREGRQVRYELADDRLAGALRELARVVLDSPACPAHLEPHR